MSEKISLVNHEAFWISPFSILLPVSDNHIGAVIRDPNIFGLTTDDIEADYAKENEQIGIEGCARMRIILDLVRPGIPRHDVVRIDLPDVIMEYELGDIMKL